MQEKNVSNDEIMDFLQEHMVTREEFCGLEGKVDNLDRKLNQTKLDLIDAMDDKLSHLKGDLTIMMRREDKKLTDLIKILHQKSVLDKKEAEHLLSQQPFPQTVQ